MPGPRAPAGWYPDPSDESVVRYWDGSAWTERAAATADPSPKDESANRESGPAPGRPVVRELTTSTWAMVGAGGLVALLVSALIGYAVVQSREPDAPFGVQPPKERAVVELIQDAREEYEAATNDLQKNATLENRDERICALLGDGRVENWTGQVYEVEDDSEGRGVLGVNIEPDTQVLTRRSAFSDTDERTLIEPGPLLDRVTSLEKGQVVTFSGQFIADEEDGSCITNPRLTQGKEIEKPLLVFRFDDVRAE